MKTHLAAAVGSVVLTAGTLLGAPAAGAQTAAYPTSPFYVDDYAASYAYGTLTWYNRSVGVDGTLQAVGCRRVWFGAYGASDKLLGTRSTSTQCNTTYPLKTGIPADVTGGATYVIVCIDDHNAQPIKCERYDRRP
ncbi:hypothetical protein QF037_009771 [Streptomyces canus]|uniref:hypothetical protein n=1 Tax=Streptomyces canus TaxID=58343 RepID=UPI002782A83B|nr:hypothetical protein [Streptomyces canus]MDQ0605426.1 hypothetical protein [Streptomyces canus]